VLTFSRAEAGREELLIEEVDICDAARRSIIVVEPQAAEKDIDVRIHSDADTILFSTDPLRIQQILINLLSNAVKFTEKGHVELKVGKQQDDLVITVTDTGPGILPEFHERIFEAFTQVDQTATRSKGGTGLGLPVSRKLAELMGGSLVVERSDTSGTTFCLRLPPRAPTA
jgi:signal transduction histidine kinase